MKLTGSLKWWYKAFGMKTFWLWILSGFSIWVYCKLFLIPGAAFRPVDPSVFVGNSLAVGLLMLMLWHLAMAIYVNYVMWGWMFLELKDHWKKDA